MNPAPPRRRVAGEARCPTDRAGHRTTAIAVTLPPMLSLEWSDIDWGTAPAWVAGVFGGLSLVLALSIFSRDRTNAERAQVDRIGPSGKVLKYTWRELDAPELAAQATAEFTVRNASDLPVHVAQFAFVWRTMWAMLDTDQPAVKSSKVRLTSDQ